MEACCNVNPANSATWRDLCTLLALYHVLFKQEAGDNGPKKWGGAKELNTCLVVIQIFIIYSVKFNLLFICIYMFQTGKSG